MTTSRMNRLVTQYYTQKDRTPLTPVKSDYFQISYSGVKQVNGYCTSTYKSFFTVPLIFYTFSKEQIECKINPKIITKDFARKLDKQLNQEYYKLKLEGLTLQIKFTSLPNHISHRYVSHFIVVPGSYYYNPTFAITESGFYAPRGAINLECKLINTAGDVKKEFYITREINSVIMEAPFEGSRRYFIFEGLDRLSQEFEYAYNNMVEELLEEL